MCWNYYCKLKGKPRGFAFIEFEEEGDADSAIDNFDDAEIFGRIYI